jgi:hypothetical protein
MCTSKVHGAIMTIFYLIICLPALSVEIIAREENTATEIVTLITKLVPRFSAKKI